MNNNHLASVKYFHQEKGDMTRYVHWEKILPDIEKEYPELLRLKKKLERAERRLNEMVDSLPDYENDE